MSEVTLPGWIQLPATNEQQQAAAKRMLEGAEDFVIDSPEGRAIADRDLLQVKKLLKEVEAARKSITGPLDAAKKAVMALFKPRQDYLESAEDLLVRKITGFDREQRAIAAKLQAEAEAAAAAERKALEEEAKRAAADGHELTAQALRDTSELVRAPVISLAPDKSETSTTVRTTWSAEVYDAMALVQAVAAGKVPLEALTPNMVYLNGRARLEKTGMTIQGVRAVSTENLAAKRSA